MVPVEKLACGPAGGHLCKSGCGIERDETLVPEVLSASVAGVAAFGESCDPQQ